MDIKITEEEKLIIINQALSTPEGKEAVLKQIFDPINKAMNINGIESVFIIRDKCHREVCLKAFALYETIIAEGFIISEEIRNMMNLFYTIWKIEKEEVIEMLDTELKNKIKSDFIKSRFDILDL